MLNATIILKEGYRLKFMGDHVLVGYPGLEPYLIKLDTLQKGDIIPRDTDQPMSWDIT